MRQTLALACLALCGWVETASADVFSDAAAWQAAVGTSHSFDLTKGVPPGSEFVADTNGVIAFNGWTFSTYSDGTAFLYVILREYQAPTYDFGWPATVSIDGTGDRQDGKLSIQFDSGLSALSWRMRPQPGLSQMTYGITVFEGQHSYQLSIPSPELPGSDSVADFTFVGLTATTGPITGIEITDPNNYLHYFTDFRYEVPEPSTAIWAGSAIVALLIRRRRN